MKERVVVFDKATGEPVAMIQSPDPDFILLNSDEREHVVKPVSENIDWRNVKLNTKTSAVLKKIELGSEMLHLNLPSKSPLT
jgi:hypothetical protein